MRNDPNYFLAQYPALKVSADNQLAKRRGHKTFGRQGSLDQWRWAFTILLDLFRVDGKHFSHLSGKELVFQSCSGLVQFSLERLNDWWYYWENLLRGLVPLISRPCPVDNGSGTKNSAKRLVPTPRRQTRHLRVSLQEVHCWSWEIGARSPGNRKAIA